MIIKAIFPLFRYDGEPSVSTGIVSQLPSSHLSIHWVPAKLCCRVYALWRILLPATALVCSWLLTDLTGSPQHWFSGRSAVSPLRRSSADRDSFPHLLRVPFQNPAQSQKLLKLSRILDFFSVLDQLRCGCLYILRIPDILQQFLRIIWFPCLQHRIDHSENLTCDHNQWLHLLERISRPCCIVGMDPFIFLSMCHRWPGCLEQPVSQPFASSMADPGLSFVLSWTTRYQPKSTQFLQFFCIIKLQMSTTFLHC